VPEGHTIHGLARDQRARFGGQAVRASSPQGRFAAGAAAIDGLVPRRIEAYGKHLFHDYGGGRVLHVHLGLYGTFTSAPAPEPAPTGAVRLRLSNPDWWADLRGATVCALVTPRERAEVLSRLGPDPLRPRSDPAPAFRRISRSRVPLAALLMDQSVLAGVGNAFRAELLYRHRLDPYLPGQALSENRFDAVWADLVALMRAAKRTGRIVTTRPADRDRRAGPVSDADRYYVYWRAGLPCRVCVGEVATVELAGRNLFWCPTCQRPGAS
jgi:endonuclease VIII